MEQDALDRLHLVHARLLYIISEMHGEKVITEDQKVKLKMRVFKDDKLIFDIYEQFKDDLATLETRLAYMEPAPAQTAGLSENIQSSSVVRQTSNKQREEENKKDLQIQSTQMNSDFDDINSPMDAQLTKKKKMLKIVHEKEQAKQGNKNTANAQANGAPQFSVQGCDEGMSPMLQKLPKPKRN